MAFSDDVFPPDDRCEICGAGLDNEIVIQEFADGSLARLCAECAAGAALGTENHLGRGLLRPDSEYVPGTHSDPLEMTKELLTPVVDLIGLQGEMQSALERLAASLERFAAGVLTENLDKTAVVEDRIQTLERELEQTRARLREAETLLGAAARAAAATGAGDTGAEVAADAQSASVTEAVTPLGVPMPGGAPSAALKPGVVRVAPPSEPADIAWAKLVTPVDAAGAVPGMPVDVSSAPSAAAPLPPEQDESARGFRIEEVQAVQRHFNDSPFTARTRDVLQSLGKPRANLTRAAGAEPRAFVTVAWDIVWYQYLVDLRRDIPGDSRVILHREGMHLDELAEHFKEKNATINDDGRLDASELEVLLLSDPSALITEMTPDEEKALEDATDEVWDQHISPEFKWDD
jgi:hypothetical protein